MTRQELAEWLQTHGKGRLKCLYEGQREAFDRLLNSDVELDISSRWNNPTHHPESIKLMEHLVAVDFMLGGDCFCFKVGGDGDNGETLMYYMDMYFEIKDLEQPNEPRRHAD